jgi:adenylate cyclase
MGGESAGRARGKLEVAFENMGEHSLKNIPRPVTVFRVAKGSTGVGTSASGPAERTKLALPDKPSLAVLPFQNMSGDPEQEYFADGMVEEIPRHREPN